MSRESNSKRRTNPHKKKHGSKVKNHYNRIGSERRHTTRQERSRSRSITIREANNWVKSVLIDQCVCIFSNNSALNRFNVIDVGVGDRGDLYKWRHYSPRITHFIGFDIAQERVEKARQVHSRLKFPGDKRQRIFPADFHVADMTADLQDHEIMRRRDTGDSRRTENYIISIQFAFHYAWADETSFSNLCNNINSLCETVTPTRHRSEQRLIMSIVNADELFRRFSELPVDIEGDELVIENSLYRVRISRTEWEGFKRIMAAERDRDGDEESLGFGCTYTFSLVDAVDNLEEYVVPLNAMCSSLRRRTGFELVSSESFRSYMDRHWDTYKRIWTAKADRLRHVTSQEWEVIDLYRVCEFRR